MPNRDQNKFEKGKQKVLYPVLFSGLNFSRTPVVQRNIQDTGNEMQKQ
jgi:hypothetical protein